MTKIGKGILTCYLCDECPKTIPIEKRLFPTWSEASAHYQEAHYKKQDKMGPYKTLEQQIRELWASRGLEVVEERFQSVGKNKFEWVIIAKEKEAKTE